MRYEDLGTGTYESVLFIPNLPLGLIAGLSAVGVRSNIFEGYNTSSRQRIYKHAITSLGLEIIRSETWLMVNEMCYSNIFESSLPSLPKYFNQEMVYIQREHKQLINTKNARENPAVFMGGLRVLYNLVDS